MMLVCSFLGSYCWHVDALLEIIIYVLNGKSTPQINHKIDETCLKFPPKVFINVLPTYSRYIGSAVTCEILYFLLRLGRD